MKKRIFSTLLALCMLLCLMPTAAFAEESTETPPACSCETPCTAESMNTDCPVCGADGALPKNCTKCAQPKGEVSDPQPEKEVSDPQPEKEVSDPQPEGEVSDPQPETALTALSGAGETPAAGGAITEVGNESALTAAIANSAVSTVKLTGDISISNSLTVNRTVTLDLNGHVLKYGSANNGSVIVVENGGQLTIEDSNTSNLSHKFMPNGKLWVLDDASGTEAVTGGVITGGTGTDLSTYGGTTWYCSGGALIKNGGSLTMRGGNIISAAAVYVLIRGEMVNRASSLCPAEASSAASPPIAAAVFLLPASSKCQVRRSFAAAPPKARPNMFAAEAYMSTSAAALKCLIRQKSKAVRQSPLLPTAEAYMSAAAVAL